MATMEQIKALREKTGVGIVDVKKALEEAGGDEEKALQILRESGAAKAVKKTDRETKEGAIATYLHGNGRIGAMVTLYCETDFVSRNDEFQSIGRDIAMHIAAMSPVALRPEEVSGEAIETEKAIWMEQLRQEGKPEEMFEKIMAGKEKKFREERALLTQAFVKDPTLSVQDILTAAVQKLGENIQVGEFTRFEV